MVKPSAYVETSILSYLAARKSHDALIAENQRITAEWWRTARAQYELYVSDLVLEEAERGDANVSKKRLQLASGITVLTATLESRKLTLDFSESLLPAKAGDDAAHIAIATTQRVDYLVTWNCSKRSNIPIFQFHPETLKLMPRRKAAWIASGKLSGSGSGGGIWRRGVRAG